jgi:putative oxidoreductase
MQFFSTLHNMLIKQLARLEGLLPLLARFVFAATLLFYYWGSGVTKLGEGVFGLFSPTVGAYYQILPTITEAASYDLAAIPGWYSVIVIAGTAAEMILPLLIIMGLLTRLSALGMIGFVIVQSLTDVWGHKVGAETIGAWFDQTSDAAILDQRLFWVFLLAVLVAKGAGKLSLDHLLGIEKK